MEHLLTEARNPASTDLDKLTPLELVRLMSAEDAQVIPAVASQAEAIARAIEVVAEHLRAGGRLVYAGAGTSGRLGVLDAAECPPTFSTPPGLVVGLIAGGQAALTTAVEGAEDHPEQGERDLQAIGFHARDVLAGIATSGRTPYVCGALAYARALGAFTIGFSCTPEADLNPLCDLAITPLVGPEVLTGSTRLKAGTATKLVLNTISTGVMVRLGKTYGNLMVDLRATNSKLRARTNRIVRHFTGLSVEAAAELLQRCDGELKTALVVHQGGLTPEEARARLQAAGGQVRVALEAVRSPQGPATVPPAADLVLGIDGGGTHTVALLAAVEKDGRPCVIGRGESGPSNLHGVGPERAIAALDEAVARAFAAAGTGRRAVQTACLGLAGAGRPEDQRVFQEWSQRIGLAAQVKVTADVALLLAAGTPEGWGVAVVAGTGSIAWGRAPDGRTARAGGWGALLGDEGSGHALGLGALRAVARAADGRGSSTALTGRLLARLQLSGPEELIAAVHGRLDRAAVAALAPVVLEAAQSGDAVAVSLAEEGTRELALAVAAVVQSLRLREQPVPLAVAGGLLLQVPSYRQRLLEHLAANHVQASPVTLVNEPAEGAIRLAVRPSVS
jgi:N-acetylmuramic acid 6-phosphate etherase